MGRAFRACQLAEHERLSVEDRRRTSRTSLSRAHAVQKSAHAGPGARPTPQEHLDSFALEAQLVNPERITIVDLVAMKDGASVLVSMKWQEASGTAEQKVPFEVMCLADAVRELEMSAAYLVLGGPGWTLRDWYVSGALRQRLKDVDAVTVLTLEMFVARANQAKL